MALARFCIWLGGTPGRGTGWSGMMSLSRTSTTPGRGVPTRRTGGEPPLFCTTILACRTVDEELLPIVQSGEAGSVSVRVLVILWNAQLHGQYLAQRCDNLP